MKNAVLGCFIRRFVFNLRIRVLMGSDGPLRVRFKEKILLRGLRGRVFYVRRVAKNALPGRYVLDVVNGHDAIVCCFHYAVGINANRANRRLGIVKVGYVRAFMSVGHFCVFALAFRGTYFGERRLVVV